MQPITSVQNARIRALRALKEKKEREAAGCFLVEGSKMVEEALAHAEVRTVVVDEARLPMHQALVDRLLSAGTDALCVPVHALEAVCDTKTPQGIAAAVALPARGSEPEGSLWVALDGVQDPGNVGTILRTADAAGFDGMLLGPGCADPFGSKALRATMGSIFRVPVLAVSDLANELTLWHQRGYAILSSELGGQAFFSRERMPERQVLVIGSEGGGISPAVSAVATHRLALPMRGGAESLNAAVAAGIMMYSLANAQEENA